MDQHTIVAALVALVVGALIWQVGPRRESTETSHWIAQERHVKDGVPIIYVRPISLDCLLLRVSLGRRGQRAMWVDIWSDDHAAAFVRDLNGGDEIVPTVIMRNGDAVTQPSAGFVARDLAGVR